MLARLTVTTLLLAMGLVLIIGCSGGSYNLFMGNIDSSNNHMTGEYRSFSGYYVQKVPFQEGQTVVFDLNVDTSRGDITAGVYDSSGRFLLDLDVSNEFQVPRTDEYTVMVEGQRHRGTFSLQWEVI